MKTSDRMLVGQLKEIASAAALDVSHWHELAEAIRAHMPETKVFMHFTDVHTTRSSPALAAGIGEDFLKSYADYYDRINPWTAMNLRSPLMTLIWTENSPVTAAARIRETEFYHDFLRPLGECDSGTAIKLAHDRSRFAQISLHYDSRIAEAAHERAAPLLAALAPTLAHSIRSLQLRQMTEEKARLRGFIDTLVDPALVLDMRGSVKAVNATMERLLEHTKVIRIMVGDILHIDDPTAAAFVDSMRQVLAEDGDGLYLSQRTEPLLRTSAGTFVLTALRLSTNVSGAWGIGEAWARAPALLLSLRPAMTEASQQIMLIRQTFGLTGAEAELAVLLAAGLPLARAAERRGVTYETARWQLKAIFAKMKVNRQSELVSILVQYIDPSTVA